jgi:glucosylceramidase
MKIKSTFTATTVICLFTTVALFVACTSSDKHDQVENNIAVTITSGDKKFLLSKADPLVFRPDSANGTVIQVDTNQRFQSIDGFGYALTGGSAYLLKQKLPDQQRNTLLKELFSADQNGIGISYLRISVGASDLDDEVFSYDDLEKGKTDPTLTNFSLAG